jgi:WD40 repeat protein
LQGNLRRRAAHWYEQALPSLTGLSKDRIEGRLKQMTEMTPDVKPTVATKEVRRLLGHSARVNSVALSADGKLAVSGSDDRTMRLWDVQTGKELHVFPAFSSEVRVVALSADGKYAASHNLGLVQTWDMATRNRVNGHAFGSTPINGLAFLMDNQRFLVGSAAPGGATSGLGTLWLMAPSMTSALSGSKRGPIYAVAACSDGRHAIIGCAEGLVQIYDVEARREVRSFVGHNDSVLGVAMTKDARQAMTCGSDKLAKLWDTQSGKLIRIFKGHTGAVTCLAMSADGRRAVTGSHDKTIRVWDVTSGRELCRFTGHTDAVTSIAISANGRHVLSASADQTVRLWDLTR